MPPNVELALSHLSATALNLLSGGCVSSELHDPVGVYTPETRPEPPAAFMLKSSHHGALKSGGSVRTTVASRLTKSASYTHTHTPLCSATP